MHFNNDIYKWAMHRMLCHYWEVNDPFCCLLLLMTEWSLLLHTLHQRLTMLFSGPENPPKCTFPWGSRPPSMQCMRCSVQYYDILVLYTIHNWFTCTAIINTEYSSSKHTNCACTTVINQWRIDVSEWLATLLKWRVGGSLHNKTTIS